MTIFILNIDIGMIIDQGIDYVLKTCAQRNEIKLNIYIKMYLRLTFLGCNVKRGISRHWFLEIDVCTIPEQGIDYIYMTYSIE